MTPDAEGPMNVGPIDRLGDLEDYEGAPSLAEYPEGELMIGRVSILEMVLELLRTLALVIGAVALVVIAVAVQ